MHEAIDISSYQSSDIAWARVKAAGIGMVSVKRTEGLTYLSPRYTAQATGAKKAGLPFAAYHFAHPGVGSGAAQADYFLAHAQPPCPLRAMLDLEWNELGLTPTQMGAWIHAYMVRIAARTGSYPIVYCSPSWWKTNVGDTSWAKWIASHTLLWLAEYGPRADVPAPWSHWTLWQYTSTGTVPGITGHVDRSHVAAPITALAYPRRRPKLRATKLST